VLEPISIEEVRALLHACSGRFAERDRAVVMLLLDSGLRAAELAALNVGHVNLASGSVFVHHGKGKKDRVSFMGAQTRRALARYLRHRGVLPDSAPLFEMRLGNRMTCSGLSQMLERLAERAGVPVRRPHSFRRAFTINMLREGADLLSLQRLLGHYDLSLLQRYAKQTEGDLQAVHKGKSPVDHLL
jgi:site-specific recombinase XerD